jgi:hypothetical protein
MGVKPSQTGSGGLQFRAWIVVGRGPPPRENLAKKSSLEVDGCPDAAYFDDRHRVTTPFTRESGSWSLTEIDRIHSSTDFTPCTVFMVRADRDLYR